MYKAYLRVNCSKKYVNVIEKKKAFLLNIQEGGNKLALKFISCVER